MFYIEFPSEEVLLKIKLIYGVSLYSSNCVCRLIIDDNIKVILVNSVNNSRREVSTMCIWSEMGERYHHCKPRIINIREVSDKGRLYIEVYKFNSACTNLDKYLFKDYLFDEIKTERLNCKLKDYGLDSYIMALLGSDKKLLYNGSVVTEFNIFRYKFFPIALSKNGETLLVLWYSNPSSFIILHKGISLYTKQIRNISKATTIGIFYLEEFEDCYEAFLKYCE